MNTEQLHIASNLFYTVKEHIHYGWPLKWTNSYVDTITRGVGHCGMKAEVLANALRDKGIESVYVVGYRCGMTPRFWPKLLDVHFWVKAHINDEWVVLDPSPDSVAAIIIGNTKVGETIRIEPEGIIEELQIPQWFRDVYNSYLLLPFKLIVNAAFTALRIYVSIRNVCNMVIHSLKTM